MEEIPPATRAKCLWGYGLLAASLGRLETAREAGYRAAELARGCGDPATTAYGLNAAAVAEWALGNHDQSLNAHHTAMSLLYRSTTRGAWPYARSCRPAPSSIGATRTQPESPEQASSTPDAPETATCWASPSPSWRNGARSQGDHEAAAAAATEALGMQEQIGYTEGVASALHVLGQAHRLAGEPGTAKDLHCQALRLASRIGHLAAMCEAMEDLARAEAAEDPAFACVLFRAVGTEREARGLPLRQRDADELTKLEATLASAAQERRRPPVRVARSGAERMTKRSILINAPPQRVCELVADPMRMADWSPECVKCRWAGRATG